MEYGDFPRERARYDGEGMGQRALYASLTRTHADTGFITLIIILIIIKTIIVVSIDLKFTVAMPSLDRSFYLIFTLYPHLCQNGYAGARMVTEKLSPNGYGRKCMYT